VPLEEARQRLLAGCDEAQREAITSDALPLCVRAGAGSGKTRVLTRRIAWRVASETAAAGHVLALTFTRKAAGELRTRLAALGVAQVYGGTFHAIALAQLRQIAADRGRPEPVVLDSKARLLAPIVGSGPARAAGGGNRFAGSRSMVSDVAGEIEWAKARLVTPDAYPDAAWAASRRPAFPLETVARLYARYEEERRRRRVLDFEDLLTSLTQVIERDTETRESQQWRFRHLFVDEFQDVNHAQLKLLEAWLGERLDLCVVGDPAQAIYAWNGADPHVMTTVESRWPGIATVHLASNYRSTPQVLRVATAIGAGALTPTRDDGTVPTITEYESDTAEARGVVAALRRANRPGRAWSQLAVLARTNAQLLGFEEACRLAGIPYRSGGGQSFLQLPAIRDALSRLQSARGPGGPAGFGRWLADLEEAASISGAHSPDGAVSEPGDGEIDPDAGHEDGASRGGRAGERRDDPDERGLDLAALARLGREYEVLDPEGGTGGFQAWLAASLRGDSSPADKDSVELTTFHRAKGLEWPVVFVTGLERGLVPIGQATDAESQAEERRLLYVALTRAQDELHCTWARQRRFGGGLSNRDPSPWLEAIEAARRELLGLASPSTRGRDHLRAGREALSAKGRGRSGAASREHSTGPLAEAIRAWRTSAARAAKVPPYVVMPDSTVDAIAAGRPRSAAQLRQIPGIGPSRVASYGEVILALVRDHPEGRA
jgi:DNA helicase-2/ATP-dependent DNA helicase PcrA